MCCADRVSKDEQVCVREREKERERGFGGRGKMRQKASSWRQER